MSSSRHLELSWNSMALDRRHTSTPRRSPAPGRKRTGFSIRLTRLASPPASGRVMRRTAGWHLRGPLCGFLDAMRVAKRMMRPVWYIATTRAAVHAAQGWSRTLLGARTRRAGYQWRFAPHTSAVRTILPAAVRRRVKVLPFEALTVATYESAVPDAESR